MPSEDYLDTGFNLREFNNAPPPLKEHRMANELKPKNRLTKSQYELMESFELKRLETARIDVEELRKAVHAAISIIPFSKVDGMEDWAPTPEAALQAPQLPEWQDIETAPKDGTRILCYFPGAGDINPMIATAIWRELPPSIHWEAVDRDQELWRRSFTTPAFFESDDGILTDPTHWQPLPAPPEVKV